MTIGDKIKDLRSSLGLTQGELAKMVGVKTPAIYKYENGLIVNLKRDTIAVLAKALNTTPSYLMGFNDENSSKADDEENNFIYALSAETQTLTDENKAKLLEMAKFFKQQQEKE